jgi:hypothetical protein
MKLCKNCIYSRLSYRSKFSYYECEEPRNLNGINLVDGEHNYILEIDEVRGDTDHCSPEGKWFVEKAKVFYPTGLEDKTRQPEKITMASLKKLTLDDIL